ncbi:MAG: hypothetical protein IJ093_03030 [Bacilli bacterium]|nr:hypothetical protein [Bacilli bacterium]
MILHENGNNNFNNKMLRGFNNTRANIVDQMNMSRKNMEIGRQMAQNANKKVDVPSVNTSKSNYDPSRQREIRIQMSRISKDV